MGRCSLCSQKTKYTNANNALITSDGFKPVLSVFPFSSITGSNLFSGPYLHFLLSSTRLQTCFSRCFDALLTPRFLNFSLNYVAFSRLSIESVPAIYVKAAILSKHICAYFSVAFFQREIHHIKQS